MEEKNYLEEREIEINIVELFFMFLEKWYLIGLSMLCLALACFAFARFGTGKEYESVAKIYIFNQEASTVTYSELQTSNYLTKDYEVLIKSRTVLDPVIQGMGLDMTYKKLRDKVAVSVPEDSRIVEIGVTTDDPYLSMEIADEIYEVASKNIAEVMGVEAVNLVEKASLPTTASNDASGMKYAIIGAMLGVILSCGTIMVTYLMNDNIRGQEDVERYLGLGTLGTIPFDEELDALDRNRSKKHRRRARRNKRQKKK